MDAEATAQHRLATGRAPALHPTAHLANFALPPLRGDFGSGAVEEMTADHAFVALVEFGRDEVGTALFAAPLPDRFTAADFSARQLQRTLAGQSGHQVFGHRGGRAFSLYAVLGRDRALAALVAEVNGVLGTIRVDAR